MFVLPLTGGPVYADAISFRPTCDHQMTVGNVTARRAWYTTLETRWRKLGSIRESREQTKLKGLRRVVSGSSFLGTKLGGLDFYKRRSLFAIAAFVRLSGRRTVCRPPEP